MKNKPLTKKQRKDLISAWAKMHILCSYFRDKEEGTNFFTEKLFNPRAKANEIYKLLDGLMVNIHGTD